MSFESVWFFAPVDCAIRELVPTAIISPRASIPQTKNVATVMAASSTLPIFPTQNASTMVKSDLTTVCKTAGIARDNISFLSDKFEIKLQLNFYSLNLKVNINKSSFLSFLLRNKELNLLLKLLYFIYAKSY